MITSRATNISANAAQRHEALQLPSEMSEFTVRFDLSWVIKQTSEASLAFLGASEGIVGKRVNTLIEEEDQKKFEEAFKEASISGKKQSFECRLLRGGKPSVWVDCHLLRMKKTNQFIMTAFDATQRKEKERSLSQLATHDPLVRLPNRAMFGKLVTVGISAATREKRQFAVLVLDLDGFKKVNDSLGHTVGDELIKSFAARMKGLVRETDMLARIGGDEFALIIAGEKSNAEVAAKKILVAAKRPFTVQGHTIYISASIGAALFPGHGESAETLIKHAEMAMYSAKAKGKKSFHIFNEESIRTDSESLALDTAMHDGIRDGEFALYYQPIFSIQTGKLKGAESLMRWEHPGLGMVSPTKFIPVAEANGLIDFLGSWALRMACRQARHWQENGIPDFYVSVNASPSQFMQEGFSTLIGNALSESGLAPSSLMLEITEGVLMNEPEKANELLSRLRALGVKIAIDDFGTGYSSLAYLKKFPLSVLKIDKAFVNDIPHCKEDVAIISAILSLAKGLGLAVVAEGVENQSQLDFLNEKGCDLVQGYLKGKPVPAAQFIEKYGSVK